MHHVQRGEMDNWPVLPPRSSHVHNNRLPKGASEGPEKASVLPKLTEPESLRDFQTCLNNLPRALLHQENSFYYRYLYFPCKGNKKLRRPPSEQKAESWGPANVYLFMPSSPTEPGPKLLSDSEA